IAKGFKEKYSESWLHDFQILSALKQRGQNSVKNLNIALQGVFNDLDKQFIERGGYQYREGDKVIHNGNNYEALAYENLEVYQKYDLNELEIGFEETIELSNARRKEQVFNGTLGQIEYIDFKNKVILIRFEDIEG